MTWIMKKIIVFSLSIVSINALAGMSAHSFPLDRTLEVRIASITVHTEQGDETDSTIETSDTENPTPTQDPKSEDWQWRKKVKQFPFL